MSYGMISILRIGSLRSPPPIRLRRTSPYSGGRIKHLEASLRKRLYSKHGLLCHLAEGERWWRQPPKGDCISSPAGRLYGFRRQRRHKKWRPWGRRTPPAGTVSQPIGKPFNGQAKGLLWLTWRSYAGPPQYFIPPEGGALNLPVRRSRSQAEPWQPRAKGPAAPSTLTPIRACQPSGIQPPASNDTDSPYVSSSWLMTRFFVFMKFGATRTTSTRAMRA